VSSICRHSVTLRTVAKRYVVGGSAIVPLDRVLVSFYRLSSVTMSLSAAVWPRFATKYLGGGGGSLLYIGSYVESKKLRSHLLVFERRQYGWLPLATAGLFLVLEDWKVMLKNYCKHFKEHFLLLRSAVL